MAAHAIADLYRPEHADLARKFCRLGATDDDLASCFEVAPRAVADWLATVPEFAEAVKQGRALAHSALEQKLFQRAMGCEVRAEKVFLFQGQPVRVSHTMRYPPDTQACLYLLNKRRLGEGPASGGREDERGDEGRP